MVEDAVVIYRLSRAPERRVFYIDVGNMPKVKAEQYLRDIMTKFRNKVVYDSATGEVKDDRKFMSMMEDFWIPRRGEGKSTEITTLPAGQNLGELADVRYFEQKLYKSLNVPVSRLETTNGFSLGRASEITRDELKFMKFVERLRSKFSILFDELMERQLSLKGICSVDEWKELKEKIHYDFLEDNNFAELKDAELLQNRLQLMALVDPYVGTYFSKAWVKKNVLQLDEEEEEKMLEELEQEQAEDPVVVYANCNTCRGVTTTTTTTTTTTAPVITSFQLQDNNEVSAYLACLNYAETLSTYYHNGSSAKPIVGDKIFEDALGTTPWNGGSYWYYMPNTLDYAIRVDNTGNVLNVSSCSGITTTTTTTTAAFTRYIGQRCDDSPSGNFALEYSTATLLTVGQVVKDNNGVCYTITTVSPSTPLWNEVVAPREGYTYIYFLYDTCLDCQGVTTTTTTTTSTTTTTTSSTTTTTTTTLPPLTSILVRRAEFLSDVCSGEIVTRYINSAIGTGGSKLYKWNRSTYVEDDLCYVVQLGTSAIWRWIPETQSFSSFGSCS